ncbi:MAG: hypothetical protein LBN06_02885 [Prevotellaceae bacterium]|jgi:hypothetical protein|nr:hypothetical protein [Prevotellaceae bacterium]
MDKLIKNGEVLSGYFDDAPLKDNQVTDLPDEIIIAAIQYMDSARERGELIPHEKACAILAERHGWK